MTPRRPTSRRSPVPARIAVGVLVLGLGITGAGLAAAAAPEPTPETTTESTTAPTTAPTATAPDDLGVAADVSQTAQRLGPPPPLDFPMNPFPVCTVLTNFGEPRSGGRTHQGADILATEGQDVYAMADGVITDKVLDGGANSQLSGNLLELTVADGTYYVYAHLSGFAEGVEEGEEVHRGEVIGYVGDTGNPGPGNYHLHFELHPGGGAAIDPLREITIPDVCTVY